MGGKHMKTCAQCGTEHQRDHMLPYLDEGSIKHFCTNTCKAAFVIRKNAERAYTGSDPT
jgi:hypothetical protein